MPHMVNHSLSWFFNFFFQVLLQLLLRVLQGRSGQGTNTIWLQSLYDCLRGATISVSFAAVYQPVLSSMLVLCLFRHLFFRNISPPDIDTDTPRVSLLFVALDIAHGLYIICCVDSTAAGAAWRVHDIG